MDDSTLHILIAFTTDCKENIRPSKETASEDCIKLTWILMKLQEFGNGWGHECAAGGFLFPSLKNQRMMTT